VSELFVQWYLVVLLLFLFFKFLSLPFSQLVLRIFFETALHIWMICCFVDDVGFILLVFIDSNKLTEQISIAFTELF